MNVSVAIWVVWAVVLFWAVGAYNRLMRLRAQAITAFAPLELQLAQYVTLVQAGFALPTDAEEAGPRVGMLAAARQFDSSLRAARAHPLDALALRALETAQAALYESWARLREAPPDLAGEPLPAALQQQWAHITLQADHARIEFNRQIEAYNEAIMQFPARVLAWLFSFKAAHTLA
jgi:LemA protein